MLINLINFILEQCYDPSLTKRINPSLNIAQKLADEALKNKSGDNITIIVVFFDEINDKNSI